MTAWIKITVSDNERNGLILVISQRWWNAILKVVLMWDSSDKDSSNMTPRLLTDLLWGNYTAIKIQKDILKRLTFFKQ